MVIASARRSRLASTRTRAGARIPTTPTHAVVAYPDARARSLSRSPMKVCV